MLRHHEDLRPLFFHAVYFGLLTLGFQHGVVDWWSVPLVMLLCVTSFQGAVQTHNAIHSPVFRGRWPNKVYQVVLTLIYGHPVSSYVPGHNLSHHKHTQTRRDVMRTTKTRFRYNGFNVLFFFFAVGPSIMRADAQYTVLMRKRHPRWFRQAVAELSILMVVQVALLIIDWRAFLVFWLLPHLYAQWGIVTMNLLQHDGCDADSEFNHSRNFVGPVLNWLTFNNGYHGIHHNHPPLHWSLTPEAHRERYAGKIHPGLEQPSLPAYAWTTFVLGRRLRYDGVPLVLPDEGPDESWLPRPEQTLADLGAETLDPTAI
jgi:fatty acid desaturase